MKPKITLINPPTHVLETIWILWQASKVDGPVPLDVEEVRQTVPQAELEKLFWSVLAQHIPVAEHINFVFMLEGVSVSLREQMVRHRIGTHVGDRVGVDIVPDLADSTWWSQSMRIQDMGKFAEQGMYRVPESLEGKTVRDIYRRTDMPAENLYHQTMEMIQESYVTLVNAGVPMEDARELIPLGAQHRISWGLNLQALLHILGKRGCWILQLGIWGPVIHGMVDELAKKVHPMFARIVAPPCIDGNDKFKSCTYQEENRRRMTGDDKLPPCPLWLCSDSNGTSELIESAEESDDVASHELLKGTVWEGGTRPVSPQERRDILISADSLVPRHREMMARAEEYRTLWKHDPYTWDKS